MLIQRPQLLLEPAGQQAPSPGHRVEPDEPQPWYQRTC